jgi:hypothetical protein
MRVEIARLRRRVADLSKRPIVTRQAVGRWVPGGPGRPPKDARARINSFERRKKRR